MEELFIIRRYLPLPALTLILILIGVSLSLRACLTTQISKPIPMRTSFSGVPCYIVSTHYLSAVRTRPSQRFRYRRRRRLLFVPRDAFLAMFLKVVLTVFSPAYKFDSSYGACFRTSTHLCVVDFLRLFLEGLSTLLAPEQLLPRGFLVHTASMILPASISSL